MQVVPPMTCPGVALHAPHKPSFDTERIDTHVEVALSASEAALNEVHIPTIAEVETIVHNAEKI